LPTNTSPKLGPISAAYAEIEHCVSCAFARRTAAEVPPRHQDGGAAISRLVEQEVRARLIFFVEAQIVHECVRVVRYTGYAAYAHETSRQDDASVDFRDVERCGDGRERDEWFHCLYSVRTSVR